MLSHSPTRNRSVSRLIRTRDLLHESLDEKLTLDRLAREAALSPGQFIRAFKAVFGETPHQVRIAARLERAKKLLITGSMPVTEVCAAVGFSSLGTFSHVFTRRVGSSPSYSGARRAPSCKCLERCRRSSIPAASR